MKNQTNKNPKPSDGGERRLADSPKFYPMLYSSPMVKALLPGRKTETRRIVKGLALRWLEDDGFTPEFVADPANELCPYGKPGDVIWVRETLYQNGELGLQYLADNEDIDEGIIPLDFNVRVDKNGIYKFCKIPNIFMEKWACRIFLKVKSVRIERLNDISESAAKNEGIRGRVTAVPPYDYIYQIPDNPTYFNSALMAFQSLWRSINGKDSWEANPWIWVIEFERTERPSGFC